jgi:hypothetical protein
MESQPKVRLDWLAKTIVVDEGMKAWRPETAAEQLDEPGSLNVVETSKQSACLKRPGDSQNSNPDLRLAIGISFLPDFVQPPCDSSPEPVQWP